MKKKILFLIMLTSCITSCYNPNDYVIDIRSKQDDIIFFINPLTDLYPADNYYRVDISAAIPANADIDKRKVTFLTTAGVFSNGKDSIVIPASVPIMGDSFLLAGTYLVCPQLPQSARIFAKVQGIQIEKVVNFTNAFPQSISVNPQTLALTHGLATPHPISATISRSHGAPSIGNIVHIDVLDFLQNSLSAYFLSVDSTSDIAGTVLLNFYAPDYLAGQDITVKAFARDSANNLLVSSVNVHVN